MCLSLSQSSQAANVDLPAAATGQANAVTLPPASEVEYENLAYLANTRAFRFVRECAHQNDEPMFRTAAREWRVQLSPVALVFPVERSWFAPRALMEPLAKRSWRSDVC